MTIYNDKAFKAEYSVSVWILKAEKSTCNEYRNMWGESVCDDNGADLFDEGYIICDESKNHDLSIADFEDWIYI